jgi:hypothetical protein
LFLSVRARLGESIRQGEASNRPVGLCLVSRLNVGAPFVAIDHPTYLGLGLCFQNADCRSYVV